MKPARLRCGAWVFVGLSTLAAAACAAVAVGGGQGGGQGGGALEVSARVLPLGAADQRTVGLLRVEGIIALSGVGGISGLWVGPGGARFAAVADDGRALSGRLTHDAAGRLNGVADLKQSPLLPAAQAQAGKSENDSEELAALPDGGWLVSFERHHRILRFGPNFAADGAGQAIPAPPDLESAPANGGVEALAAWGDGALLALEEGSGTAETTRAWFAAASPQRRDDWRGFVYRPAPGHRPSGAAALPGGDALILERSASLLGGFSARIVLLRRVRMTEAIAGAAAAGGEAAEGRELARLAAPLPTDNWEALAVVESRSGGIDLYLASDDNFSPLQTTLLMRLSMSRRLLGGDLPGD